MARIPLHFVLIPTLLLATPLLAQDDKEDEDEGWNGIRAGYHMSNLEGDDMDADPRSGFYVGYYRNIIKVPLYSLSAGMEFHNAGAIADPVELRLSYLSIPINNRLKIGPVYFDLGADLALKVGDKYLVDGTEVDTPDDAKPESFDVLVHGGAGFKLLMLGIEARYRYAVTEVFDGSRNTGLEIGLSTFF